jgi:hypothetical protein
VWGELVVRDHPNADYLFGCLATGANTTSNFMLFPLNEQSGEIGKDHSSIISFRGFCTIVNNLCNFHVLPK